MPGGRSAEAESKAREWASRNSAELWKRVSEIMGEPGKQTPEEGARLAAEGLHFREMVKSQREDAVRRVMAEKAKDAEKARPE